MRLNSRRDTSKERLLERARAAGEYAGEIRRGGASRREIAEAWAVAADASEEAGSYEEANRRRLLLERITPSGKKIIITWKDPLVPSDAFIPVGDILKTRIMRQAWATMSTDFRVQGQATPRERADAAARALVRHLRSLSKYMSPSGHYIDVSSTNQTSAPAPYDDPLLGFAVLIRVVDGLNERIAWSAQFWSGLGNFKGPAVVYRSVSTIGVDPERRISKNMGVFVREMTKRGFSPPTRDATMKRRTRRTR